jgi:hypothetical protein
MKNTENIVDVCFAIENDYFRDVLEVWVKWSFPFLLRKGEYVNGWIWIRAIDFEKVNFEEILTPEGFEEFKKTGRELTDWLYEIAIGENYVTNISYMKRKGGEMYALVFVGK